MNHIYPVEWPQFFTATIYQWQHLLHNTKHKEIITGSLHFLVKEKRIILNAFVIMSNHIHIIWQPLPGYSPSDVKASFMRHTAKQLRNSILETGASEAEIIKVNKHDREYQVWKREPLSVELFSPDVFVQKLDYIHNNPVEARLCKYPEDYFYSSAKFYHDGSNDFDMLTNFAAVK